MESSNQNLQDISQEQNSNESNIPEKSSATSNDIPSFGWSNYAERVNGRFAMLGFTAVLLIETLSHSGFLHWAGLVP